ncbi:thiol-disulfide isomerase/thioredoxin [Tenacibaculum adriaticum]|uniref:Thiol-disulfide isomerase/thioredoxin n=1 Tax=Tenacibaculum adriaticum TaxID=413713 RepID=A0A5S5DW44_9FLAO|nr:thioredoxin family protein [Tenacibaculum adriaticum]TYQ00134.1 thiol-disulfide isomerase/thioredoxin [Tenacibaculum adriaticum]
MKKLTYIFILSIFFSCGVTQQFPAKKNKDGNLIGIATKESFKQEPYGSEWFNDFYEYYETDKKVITALKSKLDGVTIKGFMGTWCGDSQREIPNLYKTLDEVGFNYINLELVTVDRKKKAKGLEKGYDVVRVPTFIFYKDGKELGRFVEHTVNGASLEYDILQIVSEKNYKHAYQK